MAIPGIYVCFSPKAAATRRCERDAVRATANLFLEFFVLPINVWNCWHSCWFSWIEFQQPRNIKLSIHWKTSLSHIKARVAWVVWTQPTGWPKRLTTWANPFKSGSLASTPPSTASQKGLQHADPFKSGCLAAPPYSPSTASRHSGGFTV